MAQVSVAKIIDAPIANVWATWDAFGDIYKFNPGVRRSRLLENSAETGLGAKRQCDLTDGKNYVREEIVEYIPQKRMKIRIIGGTMPMKCADAIISFSAHKSHTTRVQFDMNFEPRPGLLGRMMVPMMKVMMRKSIIRILAANDGYLRGPTLAHVA